MCLFFFCSCPACELLYVDGCGVFLLEQCDGLEAVLKAATTNVTSSHSLNVVGRPRYALTLRHLCNPERKKEETEEEVRGREERVRERVTSCGV